MSLNKKLLRLKMRRRGKPISAAKLIAVVFLIIIALGTCLLMLPISARSGESCSFLNALFTATSATCVTGLTPFDTYTQWSTFGQCVLLCLIEIGGLGFMSAATLVFSVFRKKLGLRERLVMAQALSLNEMDGVALLQKMVIIGSLSVEAVGALLLFFRFLPEFGVKKAAYWGVFHSISAFCNAGFDVFGERTAGSSLLTFQNDPLVLIIIAALIIIGGLGFLVWEELAEKRSFRKLSVYSKLVLSTTALLLLLGWILTCAFEWSNPDTIGEMSVGNKLVAGFFQSVTLRTAGFDAINQGGLTDSSKAIAMILMLIGGSSGSTAGGLKTVTFLVLMLFLWSRIRSRSSVSVFKRTIPQSQVMDAMTISQIMVALSIFGAIFICATSPVGFSDALFETVSALGTVGLTAGATELLSIPAKIMIIIYMYFGRVGVLTISLGFLMGNRAEERFHYAETSLLIG